MSNPIVQSLLSPAVLAFGLGAAARAAKSDLKFPPGLLQGLSIYLLLAIGLKGGVRLAESGLTALGGPLIATIALGLCGSLSTFYFSRSFGKLSVIDSAAIAAHYGSVSVVTFSAAQQWTTANVAAPEGFMPALVAAMEVPGIVLALAIARQADANEDGPRPSLWKSTIPLLTSMSMVLLIGGILIGAFSAKEQMDKALPLFELLFPGVLILYMLDLGRLAVSRLQEVNGRWGFVLGLGIAGPVVLGALGVIFGHAAGLSVAGSTVMGAMGASASYIAAPLAVRLSLPKANQGLALALAIGVSFPFNLILGIPLYAIIASWLAGVS